MSADTFKKGSIEMLVLLIMQETDSYGYQLTALIRKRSGGRLSVQEGALYPLLYRMQSDGYISAHTESVETKLGRTRQRVVYHLEQSGRQRLVQLKREYDEVQAGIKSVFDNSKEIGYERDQCD